MACWNCGATTTDGEITCPSCGSLQPVAEGAGDFDLLGLPMRFDLSEEELENRFRELQKLTHPDRFATKTEHERELSASISARANLAYDALRDPVQRAQRILRAKFDVDAVGEEPSGGGSGGSGGGDDDDDGDDDDFGVGRMGGAADMELLMRVMETRERIESAARAADASALAELLRESEEDVGQCLAKLISAFDEHEREGLHEGGQSGAVQRATALTVELRYLKKIEEEILEHIPDPS